MHSTESMILSALFDRAITLLSWKRGGGQQKKQQSAINTDDCRLTTLVNCASTALLIGLPLKGAKFCHTSNILLVGRQCCRALSRLYYNSSVSGHWSLVVGLWSLAVGRGLLVGRSVHNENCCAMTFGGNYSDLYIFPLFQSPST